MTNDIPLTPLTRQEDMANNPTLRYFTEVRQQEPEYEFQIQSFIHFPLFPIVEHQSQSQLFEHYSM